MCGRTAKAPFILEIADGTKLRFPRDAVLEIGRRFAGAPGALIALHVTCTSAAAAPRDNEWKGLSIGALAKGTQLSAGTIEHAGQGTAKCPGAAVSFDSAEALEAVDFRNVVFRDTSTRGAAVSVSGGGDCAALARAGNRSLDVPLCAK